MRLRVAGPRGDRLNLVEANNETMGQQTLDGTDITALREQYHTLVDEQLPAAADDNWPVQADHCFARIVLDSVFEDRWDDHVEGRPAYRSLSAAELRRAIDVAEQLLAGGPTVVREYNIASLRYREQL